jgi:two-component system, cell cycle response regulator DivK
MKKILIAEDNPVNRELLRELLEVRGYDVCEACNGQEALTAIAAGRPDILLLDLDMPVLDGYETIRRIRQDACMADLPVLAVTAYAMQGDREKILNAGFNGYLSKPIDSVSLNREMQRLLASSDAANPEPAGRADAAGSGS